MFILSHHVQLFRGLLTALCTLVFPDGAGNSKTLLRQLHWLRVPERITFKLAILMFHCVNGTVPGYLSATLDESPMYQAANTYAQLHHLHLPFQLPDVLQLVIAPSSSQPPLSGTSFLEKSDLPHHELFSDVDWKLIFSIAFNSCKVIEVFFHWKHLSL